MKTVARNSQLTYTDSHKVQGGVIQRIIFWHISCICYSDYQWRDAGCKKKLPYKPQLTRLSGDKAKDMKAMLKYMPNADKEYYTTLLTMNDSQFETSDATNEQRMVDEVPMPLPAEAQSGRMTRQRVTNRE